MNTVKAANKAIDVLGPVALARELETSRHRVQKWRKRGVPAVWVLAVENATGISKHLLAPEIYPCS